MRRIEIQVGDIVKLYEVSGELFNDLFLVLRRYEDYAWYIRYDGEYRRFDYTCSAIKEYLMINYTNQALERFEAIPFIETFENLIEDEDSCNINICEPLHSTENCGVRLVDLIKDACKKFRERYLGE